MTDPQPTERELELQRQLDAREQQLEELRTAMETREAEFRTGYEQLQQLLQTRPTQDAIDAVTSERNTARQQLNELQQEHDRVRSVLGEVIAGVQTWVPDLTPISAPPSNIPPEMHPTWIRDQIAGRRQEWDSFVHRVVTQATV